MDKVLYPKELGIILEPYEMFELEHQLRKNNQIDNNTFVYADDENNIRIKTIPTLEAFLEDSNEIITNQNNETIKINHKQVIDEQKSEYTEHLDLMEA